MRFAIKHLPTNKFLYENEVGTFLIDQKEIIIEWGLKESTDLILEYLMKCPDGIIYTDDGEYPASEFDVVAL